MSVQGPVEAVDLLELAKEAILLCFPFSTHAFVDLLLKSVELAFSFRGRHLFNFFDLSDLGNLGLYIRSSFHHNLIYLLFYLESQ